VLTVIENNTIKNSRMEIIINDSLTISEFQKAFSSEFPYLKIEFFDAPYKAEKALPKSKMYSHERKIGSIRKQHEEGRLVVTSQEKVSDIELELWKKYGLSAQIFRRSGNVWIETSLTDSWSLEQQNREGFELSKAHKTPFQETEENDPTDRDKWE
jgi:hypothetical protein